VHHQLGIIAHGQRRFADAEASYHKALDILEESGDRRNTASVYHQLGNLAYTQGQLAEAEAHYNKAIDIYIECRDPYKASGAATRLGTVLARLGRTRDAAAVLLYAAVSWRQETGSWADQDLQWLHRERALMDAGEFAALVRDSVPEELTGEVVAAIDAAGDPVEETAHRAADSPDDNR
jgi:tetratricopeptide (TPR) repeat protein